MSQQTLAPFDLPVATVAFEAASFVAQPLTTHLVDTTNGAVTASLPDASTMVGRALVIYLQVHSSSVTIAQLSGQQINASDSNLTLSSANTAYTLLSVPNAASLNGAQWLALSGLLAQ